MKLTGKIAHMVKAHTTGHFLYENIFLGQKKACPGQTVLAQVLLEGKTEGIVKFAAEIALAVREGSSDIIGGNALVISLD